MDFLLTAQLTQETLPPPGQGERWQGGGAGLAGLAGGWLLVAGWVAGWLAGWLAGWVAGWFPNEARRVCPGLA